MLAGEGRRNSFVVQNATVRHGVPKQSRKPLSRWRSLRVGIKLT